MPEPVTITFTPPAERDWDSYGAAPTSDAAIKVARALCIVPTVNGGVQIELHAGGHDIEIEYDEHGRLETFLVAPTPTENQRPQESR